MRREVARFLEHLEVARNLSPHTVAAYRRDLGDLEVFASGYLGRDDFRWSDIDRGVIRSFLGEAGRRGLAPRTVARKLSAVRALFRYLHREGEIPSNPARHVRGPKLDRTLPAHMRVEEVSELFRWVEARAAMRDMQRLIARVLDVNDAGLAFFDALGYRPVPSLATV